jgi:hypothetical protein
MHVCRDQRQALPRRPGAGSLTCLISASPARARLVTGRAAVGIACGKHQKIACSGREQQS